MLYVPVFTRCHKEWECDCVLELENWSGTISIQHHRISLLINYDETNNSY